jgi:acylaminoacyl-peptidase
MTHRLRPACLLAFAAALLLAAPSRAQDAPPMEYMDVFAITYASDPQISPDGEHVAYVRRSMDVMKDRVAGALWLVQSDGGEHRPLVPASESPSSPRWSPDGTRLAYTATDAGGKRTLFVHYLASGVSAPLAQMPSAPGGFAWSPEGEHIAYTAFVDTIATGLAVDMPSAPEGAEWAAAPRVIETTIYRRDGGGYVEPGASQAFVIRAGGGMPRQLTHAPGGIGGTLAWSADGGTLYASTHPVADSDERDLTPGQSDLIAIDVASGAVTLLTDRDGPDSAPKVSPRGDMIAYRGYDNEFLGYHNTQLYVMPAGGGTPRSLTAGLDRSISDHAWREDGSGLYVLYDDEGETARAFVPLDGAVQPLPTLGSDMPGWTVGGGSIGRPYPGGSCSYSESGRAACMVTHPQHAAEVAAGPARGALTRITHLTDDLAQQRELARVEEIRFPSRYDGLPQQAWVAYPPGFDPAQEYPLIIEIHGGPFQNYGPRFSAEVQLFAAAGYVVVYANPRGSTSYGADFANEIHHDYPSQDYDDLMSAVDAVVARGSIDTDRLYVTGGSGGGVLTAWLIGQTDRFRAAVVAKPVINWASWVGTADMYPFGAQYWFPGLPWEEGLYEHYWQRSPLALVGNVTTPTMVLTGENDVRTPMSESEQYYQALRLERVPSALVRIPGAAHGIAARPSQLVAKVAHIVAWFERYE